MVSNMSYKTIPFDTKEDWMIKGNETKQRKPKNKKRMWPEDYR